MESLSIGNNDHQNSHNWALTKSAISNQINRLASTESSSLDLASQFRHEQFQKRVDKALSIEIPHAEYLYEWSDAEAKRNILEKTSQKLSMWLKRDKSCAAQMKIMRYLDKAIYSLGRSEPECANKLIHKFLQPYRDLFASTFDPCDRESWTDRKKQLAVFVAIASTAIQVTKNSRFSKHRSPVKLDSGYEMLVACKSTLLLWQVPSSISMPKLDKQIAKYQARLKKLGKIGQTVFPLES